MLPHDPLSRVLYVDLSSKRFWVRDRRDLFEQYLGGTGVASHLLEEESPPELSPLAPESPIIFAVGPLNGLFPIASKTVAMFPSPHTGNLGESHAGGRSATSLRLAGYGAVVIRGRSEIPVYLVINQEGVRFVDARALWGLSVSATGRIIREREEFSGLRSILRIGPAGEKQVTYSCVVTETYRHFGRLGLGALFGAKNLKAVVFAGRRALPVKDRKGYRLLYDKILKDLKQSPSLKKYHDLGTAVNVLPLNKLGGLPTRNLQEAHFENAEKISGEYLAQNLLGRRLACSHCPMACIHLAALRTPYENEPYFYKTTFISYDYELLYALGSMIGVGRAEELLKLLDKVDNLGLDAISTGVVLAWATEAFERGLISERETLGLKPSFGDAETYLQMLSLIVSQPNTFYEALARGVEFASSRFGGQDFALAFGKNEMPGYHTGYGAYLGFLTGSRHSHLDSAGYSYDQKLSREEIKPQKLASLLFEEEIYRQVLSSAVCCFFGRSVYTYETLSEALEICGFSLPLEELKRRGANILKTKYLFKKKRGFEIKKLRLPKRILKTVSPQGKLKESFLREALSHFRNLLESL